MDLRVLRDAQTEMDLLRGDQRREEALEEDRFQVDEEIQPTQDREVGEMEPLGLHDEPGGAAVVRSLAELPLLVEAEAAASDVLVVVERADAEGDPVVRFGVELGAEEEGNLDGDHGAMAAHPPDLGDHGVEVPHVLEDMGGINLVEVVVGEGPRKPVKVPHLVPAKINDVEIDPFRLQVDSATDVQTPLLGGLRDH